jgi:hypothetical protein
MIKMPPALLWIATALNLYLAAKVACWNIRECRGTNAAQGDLGIAMIILLGSIPLSIALLTILVAPLFKRFSVSEVKQFATSKISIFFAVLNILAPGFLLFSL